MEKRWRGNLQASALREMFRARHCIRKRAGKSSHMTRVGHENRASGGFSHNLEDVPAVLVRYSRGSFFLCSMGFLHVVFD